MPLTDTSASDLWKILVDETPLYGAYFGAQRGIAQNFSTLLNINSANSSSNFFPIANLTSPEDNFKASVNYPVSFTHESKDEDDLLKINWSFGDGSSIISAENYSYVDKLYNPSLGNENHSYSSVGVYKVTLTASEMTRSQYDTDSIMVYVFEEGTNVVPIITSPEDGMSYGSGWVQFDATESYAANCSYDNSSYEFLAGNLYCVTLPNDKLKVTWNVTTAGVQDFYNSSMWGTSYSSNKIEEFLYYFPVGGEHVAKLRLDYI